MHLVLLDISVSSYYSLHTGWGWCGVNHLSAFDRSGHELQLIVRSAGGEGDRPFIRLNKFTHMQLSASASVITLSIQAPTATLSLTPALYTCMHITLSARHSIHEMCANVNLCQQEWQVSNQAAAHFLLGAFLCL
jgi:hypothetical protein